MITEQQREMASRILGAATGRTLRRGARGKTVRALQLFLRDQGIEIRADGVFGDETAKALKQYQAQQGLASDGVAGAQTFKAIRGGITPMPNLRPRKTSPELAAIQPPAEPPPMPEQPSPELSAMQPPAQPMTPPQPDPSMGMEFGDTFPPEAARGYEMARESLEAAGGNKDMTFTSDDYVSAHDQLVRALTGRQEPGPPDIGMANSPLATEQQYQPGMPYFDQANPGVDSNMAGLADAMRRQGMTPSGEMEPQNMALLRALLAR